MAEAGGMQLLGLSVTGPRSGAEDVILASAMDLSQFSFFQRGTCVRPRRRAPPLRRCSPSSMTRGAAAPLPPCQPGAGPRRAAHRHPAEPACARARAGWRTS